MSNCRAVKRGIAEKRACILSKVLPKIKELVKKNVIQTYFITLSNVSVETVKGIKRYVVGQHGLGFTDLQPYMLYMQQNELKWYPIAVNSRLLPSCPEQLLYQLIYDVSYGKSERAFRLS